MSDTMETLHEVEQPARPSQPDRPPWWDEIGARSLAFAGGAVTLLGVVLLYLFASRAGWIGAGLRVAFGAVFSAALLTAAPLVRRRYGHSHASDVTAGVGLASAYVTLFAASALYGFLSPLP